MPKATLLQRAERQIAKDKTALKAAAEKEILDREHAKGLQDKLHIVYRRESELENQLSDMASLKADMANIKDELGVTRSTSPGTVLRVIELLCTMERQLKRQR